MLFSQFFHYKIHDGGPIQRSISFLVNHMDRNAIGPGILLSLIHIYPSAAIADKVAVPSDNTSASIHTATVLLFISSTPIPDLHSTEAS